MTLLTSIKVLFLLLLIICGGVHISIYDKCPATERIRIFLLGLGMYIAAVYLCIS